MMESVRPYLGPIGLILPASMAGVVSPGPCCVQVARMALSRSPADGLAYLRTKAVVDRVAAGAMGLLGLRLVVTAHAV